MLLNEKLNVKKGTSLESSLYVGKSIIVKEASDLKGTLKVKQAQAFDSRCLYKSNYSIKGIRIDE